MSSKIFDSNSDLCYLHILQFNFLHKCEKKGGGREPAKLNNLLKMWEKSDQPNSYFAYEYEADPHFCLSPKHAENWHIEPHDF